MRVLAGMAILAMLVALPYLIKVEQAALRLAPLEERARRLAEQVEQKRLLLDERDQLMVRKQYLEARLEQVRQLRAEQ